MPTGADNRDQWLRTIRSGAEKAHFGTAVYDFIGSQSSLICADTHKVTLPLALPLAPPLALPLALTLALPRPRRGGCASRRPRRRPRRRRL
jgi:hypothetical protein